MDVTAKNNTPVESKTNASTGTMKPRGDISILDIKIKKKVAKAAPTMDSYLADFPEQKDEETCVVTTIPTTSYRTQSLTTSDNNKKTVLDVPSVIPTTMTTSDHITVPVHHVTTKQQQQEQPPPPVTSASNTTKRKYGTVIIIIFGSIIIIVAIMNIIAGVFLFGKRSETKYDQTILNACDFFSMPYTKCINTTSFNGLITGKTIPSELGLLTQMTALDLHGRWLTGTIPSTLGQLTNLTFLQLSQNSLTGTIPSSLRNLKQLTFLGLGYTQLTGSIPSELGYLTRLTTLGLSNIKELGGTVPSSLCNSRNTKVVFDCYTNGNIACSCCYDSSGRLCVVN
jgi:Leucine-rich repeat (LRR) protein